MRAQEKTILVVDDDALICCFLQEYLNSKGFDVILAEDGFKVLLFLEYVRPDLIICDVVMPGIDGITLLQSIRNRESIRDLPVILMSARREEEGIMQKARELGVKYFLAKPVDLKALDMAIDYALRPTGT